MLGLRLVAGGFSRIMFIETDLSFGQWKYVRDFGGDHGVLLSGGQDFGGEKLS